MEKMAGDKRLELLRRLFRSTYSTHTLDQAAGLVGMQPTVAEREAMAEKLTPLVGVLSEKDFLKFVEDLLQKFPKREIIWPEGY